MNQPDSTLDGKALTVEVSIDEHPKRTRAKAKLHWRGRELTGIGLARLNPADRNITEIGDELAVARPCATSPISCSRQRRPISTRPPTSPW